MYGGILAACGMCGQTTGWWWRQGGDEFGVGAFYYPLHQQRCVEKMIELWEETLSEGGSVGLSDAPLAGAYARRAEAYAQRAASRGQRVSDVTVKQSINGGSPYFQPGMAAGTPWTAVARSVLGTVVVVPYGRDEQRAIETTRVWHLHSELGDTGPGEAPMVGGCVVGPDGAVTHGWGHVPEQGSVSPWEPIERATWARGCGECGTEIWLGRWRGMASGRCMECLRRAEPRPWWPRDAPRPVPVAARSAKKKADTLD